MSKQQTSSLSVKVVAMVSKWAYQVNEVAGTVEDQFRRLVNILLSEDTPKGVVYRDWLSQRVSEVVVLVYQKLGYRYKDIDGTLQNPDSQPPKRLFVEYFSLLRRSVARGVVLEKGMGRADVLKELGIATRAAAKSPTAKAPVVIKPSTKMLAVLLREFSTILADAKNQLRSRLEKDFSSMMQPYHGLVDRTPTKLVKPSTKGGVK